VPPLISLVSTPIGHLGDLSHRAFETLANADLILCEDTRHSLKLLNHYEIRKPLRSYHQFNEAKRESEILQLLREGKQVALISDAGTPGISDPGERIVKACIEAGLEVTAVPGPCAIIQALVLSGFPTEPFQFVGFLPRRSGRLTRVLEEIAGYGGTTVAYESPKRIPKVLPLIAQIMPERPLAIARELTKKFEEVLRGTAEALIPRCGALKGETVLVIGPHV
jgi:16S rRNA (cytidine1402-2'-O)-methyltransferase